MTDVSGQTKATVAAVLAAMATSGGGCWQFMENRAARIESAVYEARSVDCGKAYVGLTNAVGARLDSE